MMAQITWFWVVSQILNKEKEKQKSRHEHNCLSFITNQIIKIHEEGGFKTEVMGWRVCVK
jgi:hypothetical protein